MLTSDSRLECKIRQALSTELSSCLDFESLDEYGRSTPLDAGLVAANILCGGIFIATVGDDRIGYASLNFLYTSRTPMLSWWYVKPEYRGHGVGSRLLQEVSNYLRSHGFRRFLISCCRPLEIARHEARGLKRVGYLDLGGSEQEVVFEQLV
ncbi:GNAT family N-acetyltransferase [Burkholderia sp. Bp9126]|nr:GNAT family N-acetyltransferase [Burkholderia sp. Bp9126]